MMSAEEIHLMEREMMAERDAFDARSAQAKDLASSAYYMAVDQQKTYASLTEALDVHIENAIDTACGLGIDPDMVSGWFWRFVDGKAK